MKIVLNKEQNVFFTSDTHFNHRNIVRGVTEWENAKDKVRDFDTLEEMDETLIKNINETVGQKDILFHLGDFSFNGIENIQKFRNRINCETIYVVRGNHDNFLAKNQDGVQSCFTKVFDPYLELQINIPGENKNDKHKKYNFVLSHYPIVSWNGMNRGYFHIHGHTHLPNNLKLMPGRGFDCGVDGNPDFCPYSLNEVVKLLKDRPIKSMFSFDHHIEEVR